MSTRTIILAHAAAAASSASAGVAVVISRFLVQTVDPLAIASLRYLIGFLCVAALARTLFSRVLRRDLLTIALLGILFFGVFPWLFTASVVYTTSTRAALALCTSPIITLAVASMLGYEALTPMKAVGVLLAFAGVAFALGFDGAAAQASDLYWFGDLLMIAAAVVSSVYAMKIGPVLRRNPALAVTALAMLAGTAGLTPLAAGSGTYDALGDLSTVGWAAVATLGVVCGAMQFILYTWSLRWLSPARAVVYITLSPISAMVLAVVFLGERVTGELLIGLVLVAAGILTMARAREAEVRQKSTA